MKLLILSNNPLDNQNSNGRTLNKMLNCFGSGDILNVFISGGLSNPADAYYYKIDEKRLLTCKSPYGTFLKSTSSSNNRNTKKITKTAFKCLIRSLIWRKRKILNEIYLVAKKHNPDAILVQCGDSDFLINLSIKLSQRLSVPLVSFNSEDYIFKKWDYMKRTDKMGLFFRVFIHNLINSYKKLYLRAKAFIYLNDSLKDLYDSKFGNKNSFVIYNSTDIIFDERREKYNGIVYSGNLGVGRANVLIELSRIIYKISGEKINVYSLTNNKGIIMDMKKEVGINYIGPIDYTKNKEIICGAKLLLLIDAFDDFYSKDTKNAFSTKIADSIASGTPLMIISPKDSATYNYFCKENCSFLCSNIEDARVLFEAMQHPSFDLLKFQKKQLAVAKTNHSAKLNSKKLYNIVKEITKK